jgi:hypothetical protein
MLFCETINFSLIHGLECSLGVFLCNAAKYIQFRASVINESCLIILVFICCFVKHFNKMCVSRITLDFIIILDGKFIIFF